MRSLLGLGAALLSPLMMVIGFIIWDKHWRGSAFALNIFKCSFASLLLLIMVLSTGTSNISALLLSSNGGILMLSAMLGIVIGDNTWLRALRLLGARRVILVDALKPWLAAVLGHFLLDEDITVVGVCGMFVTIFGVVIVSLERSATAEIETNRETETEGDNLVDRDKIELMTRAPEVQNASPEKYKAVGCDSVPEGITQPTTSSVMNTIEFYFESSELRRGYFLALLNVCLDCLGSVLTKMYGENFNTWEINLIRFGSAAVVMGLLASGGKVHYNIDRMNSITRHSKRKSTNTSTASSGTSANNNNTLFNTHALSADDVEDGMEVRETSAEDNACIIGNTDSFWFHMPFATMTRHDWLQVTLGVVFVTFLCPVLSIYALFTMDVALCLTLTSLGPLYSLPLVFLMKGERMSLRGGAGTALACIGVVILTAL